MRIAREHDFTKMWWGWAISVEADYTAIGHGFGIHPGDTILLKMTSGRVGRALIQKIDYYLNPKDMFTAKVQPLGYKED